MLDIRVELLYAALFEVEVLRLQRARKIRRRLRCRDGREESIGQAAILWGDCNRVPERTRRAGEVVRLRQIRRILPQPLCALVPRRVMEDGIAGTNRCVLAVVERLPGQTNAGLDRRFIQLNSYS